MSDSLFLLSQLVAHLQEKYFEAEAARESLVSKVEALEATAANLNASIINAVGNMSSSNVAPKEGAAEDAADTDGAAAAAADASVSATQNSFLGDVQDQLKAFQSQFDDIKSTVQGESEKQEDAER